MKTVIALTLALGCTLAGAQQPAAEADESARVAEQRQRLEARRSEVESEHDARERECWQRFAVNACLREVRRSRYAALDPLRLEELQLNAQERALRTRQRDERLRDKQATQERQP